VASQAHPTDLAISYITGYGQGILDDSLSDIILAFHKFKSHNFANCSAFCLAFSKAFVRASWTALSLSFKLK
jgi:hypothetical protein